MKWYQNLKSCCSCLWSMCFRKETCGSETVALTTALLDMLLQVDWRHIWLLSVSLSSLILCYPTFQFTLTVFALSSFPKLFARVGLLVTIAKIKECFGFFVYMVGFVLSKDKVDNCIHLHNSSTELLELFKRKKKGKPK